LSTGRTPTLLFWHRTDSRELIPIGRDGVVAPDDPPPMRPGMRTIVLDPDGRLVGLRVVPPSIRHDGGAAPPPNWEPLFEAAGLSFSSFRPASPRLTPPVFSDINVAFEGPLPELSQQVRVELA